MTPAEADQRILLSQTTFDGYRKMIERFHWPVEDLPLFEEEIKVLEAIAEEHPGKINQLISLVAQWAALHNRLQAKIH
ncbi:MAG: hypothetical protein KME20_27795 [Kaiparowitsia implicata GSE-PSE-MK54-09C]|jgi:hypothetical protein|nr:hypothetical protein [Kaiparowitsia implicata GSE-PSE-MK54-09C]